MFLNELRDKVGRTLKPSDLKQTVEFNVKFGKASKGMALASNDGFGVFVARLSPDGLASAGELPLT